MSVSQADIPRLFRHDFSVDETAPFRRHLNRLEVEVGGEDYGHLKELELLPGPAPEARFDGMEELTERLLKTTQNNYNRHLLQRLGVRVYLDHRQYAVHYRLGDRTIRFVAAWRQAALRRLFSEIPATDTGWNRCALPAGCDARFLPDRCGGVLLLRRRDPSPSCLPLLTATHGPYDPHTFETALLLLHTGRGAAAIVNLGFSGREPLTDANLGRLRGWGVPLNPSNIDVIYPYTDEHGHPLCYKLEEHLCDYSRILGTEPPQLLFDLHGCVGVERTSRRIVVGLGGLPPYPEIAALGNLTMRRRSAELTPTAALSSGLRLLQTLSPRLCVQFCSAPHCGFHLTPTAQGRLKGRMLDPAADCRSLCAEEERSYLPQEQERWLPGAGGNALQRRQAARLRPDLLCLHVELPDLVRRRMAQRWQRLERQSPGAGKEDGTTGGR